MQDRVLAAPQMPKDEVEQDIQSERFPPCILYKIFYTSAEEKRVKRGVMLVDLVGADVKLSFGCSVKEEMSECACCAVSLCACIVYIWYWMFQQSKSNMIESCIQRTPNECFHSLPCVVTTAGSSEPDSGNAISLRCTDAINTRGKNLQWVVIGLDWNHILCEEPFSQMLFQSPTVHMRFNK